MTNCDELVKTLDHRNGATKNNEVRKIWADICRGDFRMATQNGMRQQIRVDSMGQAAMCEMWEKDGTRFWEDTKRCVGEAISGQDCKVQGNGGRHEVEHLKKTIFTTDG